MFETDELIRQLRSTLGKVEVALGSLEEAIVWTDPAGRIQWCNGAFDRLLGRPHIEILGGQLETFLPLECQGEPVQKDVHPVFLCRNGEAASRRVYVFQAAGNPVFVEITASRFRAGEDGTSFIFAIRDVTTQAQLEALRKEKEVLAEANRIMLGREGRVLELKQEVNTLLKQTGRPPRYNE